jgi:hypothetical protein
MRRRLHSDVGQTTTEFVMIGGLTLVVALGFLSVMNPTVRTTLQQAVECVISDVCDQVPDDSLPVPSVFPGSSGSAASMPESIRAMATRTPEDRAGQLRRDRNGAGSELRPDGLAINAANVGRHELNRDSVLELHE